MFSASGAQFSESISNVDVLLLAVLQPTSASGFNNIVFGTYNPTTSNQAGNMGVTYNPSNNTASVTVNANIGPSVLFTNNLNVFYLLRRGEYIKVRSGGGSSAQTHTFTLNANSFGLGSAWITDIKSLTGYASEFIAFIGSIPADDEIEEMVENMKLFWGAD